MKIAMYYSCPFETGGVEKTMFLRGKKLAEAGYDVTFIYSNPNAQLCMLEKWATVGDVKHINICKDEVFDYVIYDSIYNNKRVNAKKNNYIQVINGCLVDSQEPYEEKIPFKKYVSVSDEAREQFIKCKGKDSIVIPNLIDEEEVIKLSKEKVNIPKKKHNFVIVSRIDRQKGFDRFEEVLKKCEKEFGDDYQFVVVGGCNLFNKYVEDIKSRLSKYNVIWEGVQDNPYKYMRWGDSLWQLSDFESQCMVMYEALICGTPCVCTDFPNAVKELKDGRGFIVKKDLSNLDLKEITKLKKGFEYHYPDYSKEWIKLLDKPIKKKDYKFSIIIPNYNNGRWLEKCINSVLNQTYKNYEIIYVDDMSTDNSMEIAKKMLKDHKVLKVPYKKYNGGTRNIGIIEATGDYIMCIDSDDWLKNDKVLEDLNNFIEDEDIIRTGYQLYNGSYENMFTDIPKHNGMYDLFTEPTCAVWTKVIKREILQNTLFSEGTLMEDKVHHYRIVDRSNSWADFPQVTHIWNRTNTKSVSTERNYKWDNSMYRHIADMLDFINETKNERYIQFVRDKVSIAKKMLEKGDFKQI